eukprot:g60883.t1
MLGFLLATHLDYTVPEGGCQPWDRVCVQVVEKCTAEEGGGPTDWDCPYDKHHALIDFRSMPKPPKME